MIRHVAVFRFVPGTSDEAIDGIDEALGRLPTVIPDIVAYRFGRDLGWSPDNADYVVVADFASQDDFTAYLSHPDHVAVVTGTIAPVLDVVTRVQYRL